ncbi:uncharacterized protein EV420DRAFT_1769366 [Desarmillaria tabescens]|uniref:Uncharacterized protein n=1 Tax=Armillaria tabescens TaxID=1929756 RepID=A0AA39JC15_ARMTA|nr:uncharacterized protein EV420DRAFT_1769366 [Desarmillaria tabescens]KAK0439971.1 hypothetical protein EV420DRAFT_1769366 [Desarmillaria tabescens]
MNGIHSWQATAYIECIARSSRDPDMQGYAVRLSIFIANVMLAILIKWSHDDVTESVRVVLVQVYSIILVTFISMWRRNLSMADAHFALSITVSPLSVYFLYSTLRVCLKKRNTLYERLGKSKIIVGVLTTIMLILWIVLDLLIYFAHVFEGEVCPSPTVIGWFIYRSITAAEALEITIYFLPLLPFFYLVYAVRHFSDVREEYRRHMRKVVPWPRFRCIQITWFSVRSFCLSQWIVITRAHPWTVFLCILLAYMCWAGTLKIWIVDMDYYYYELLQSFGDSLPYEPRINYDPLGFGQLLAATVAIEPIYAVCLLTWNRRADLRSYIRRLPSAFRDGIIFIVSGRGNPWRIMHYPLQNISPQEKHPSSRARDAYPAPKNPPHRAPPPRSSTRPAEKPQAPGKSSHSPSGRASGSDAAAQTPKPSHSEKHHSSGNPHSHSGRDVAAQTPKLYHSLPTSSRPARDRRHDRRGRHNSDRYSPAVGSNARVHSGPGHATPSRPSASSHHREKSSVTPYDPPAR